MSSLDPLRSGQAVNTAKTQNKTNTVSNGNEKINLPKSAKQDGFSISEQSKNLSIMSKELAKSPYVDQSKVASLKSAIDNGSYKVDSTKLAQNMLNFDKAFKRS